MPWRSKLAARRRAQTIWVRVTFNPTHFVLPDGQWVYPPSVKGTMLDSLNDQPYVAVEVRKSDRGPGLWTLLWAGTPRELWKEGEPTAPPLDFGD
jgi:hypothetical protein